MDITQFKVLIRQCIYNQLVSRKLGHEFKSDQLILRHIFNRFLNTVFLLINTLLADFVGCYSRGGFWRKTQILGPNVGGVYHIVIKTSDLGLDRVGCLTLVV